mmetsp:Transcript_17817/g.30206  ORF Transcript_17817/g.30206 Transcript_17817/m.30206 type:complete len:344 (+) Transcript_17817:115-1146(+)
MRRVLNAISGGSSAKMSLLKTLAIKTDENLSTFKRMLSCIDMNDLGEIGRLVYVLEEQNHSILNEIQGELAGGVDWLQNVATLSELVEAEKLEYEREIQQLRGGPTSQRGRKAQASASPEKRGLSRSTSGNAPGGGRPDLTGVVYDLRKQLQSLQIENDKLRSTMREMIEDYTGQLDIRDQTIRQLEQQDIVAQNEVSMLIYKENEALKQENRMLRDKVGHQDEELARANVARGFEAESRVLKEDVERLNRALLERERLAERQLLDQKNEWTEIYNQQRQKIEQGQLELHQLQDLHAQLKQRLENSERSKQLGPTGTSSKSQLVLERELNEIAKRLKKRELEC